MYMLDVSPCHGCMGMEVVHIMGMPRLYFLILLWLLFSTRASGGINEIIVFGDSLSDMGNVDETSFGLVPSDDYYDSRVFSNGAPWIRTLALELGVTEPSYSLSGSSRATNYAYGGAQTGNGDSMFESFLIPGIGGQIDAFKADGRSFGRQSICTLWIGGNDLNGTSSGNAQRVINSTISNLEDHLEEVISLGAPQIVVPNLPLLGEIPQHNGNNSRRRQQNELVIDYNARLAALIATLRQRHPVTRIIEVDVAGFMAELLENPGVFGFTNVRDQAYTPGLLGGIFGGSVVSNPDEYVFWDDLHPTGPIHELVGMMAAREVQRPPVASILEVRIADSDALIRFDSLGWVSYRVERSLDLREWKPIGGEIPGTGSLVSITDPGAGNFPAAFYRLAMEW